MKTIAAPKQRRDDVIDINSGIKPGDIVQLKTGGPKMVVMRIVVHGQHKDREAECYWWAVGLQGWGGVTYRGNIPWGKIFPLPGLVKVEKNGKVRR